MVKTISEIIEEISLYYKKKGEPECEHTLTYDSSSETLEPIYFFILDLMNDFGLKSEKLVDNFAATPGGANFSDIGMKKTRLQEEAMKMMGSANTVLRSVLNLLYDLKEFKIRLQHYDDLKSKDKNKKQAAILALKQIWMDKVDIQKGNSSVKAMALGQAGFQTLLDAFLVAKDEKDTDKLDLNDRVKRIVKQRISEFNIWLKQSEKELRKRFDIEKTYLRSQVNSLKLYSRWARPYLRNAQKLEMKESDREAGLVNMFNTLILELTLLGKSKLKIPEEALEGNLPIEFKKMADKNQFRRGYYACILVDFRFRAIPRQGVMIGRSDISFKAYALNDDELKKLEKELEKSDLGDVLGLIEGSTTESLDKLQEEIEEFLKDEKKEEEKKEDKSNPFLALIGHYNKKSEKKETKENKKEIKEVKPDNWIEKEHLRKLSASNAEETCFKLFDIYKKAHGMASFT